MSLLELLSDEKVWIDFYEQKVDPLYFRLSDARKLFEYIREKRFVKVAERITNRQGLSIPQKKSIAKSGSQKKRIIYNLPEEEATTLKLLTWLMIRKYDGFFSDNLYSFRPSYSAKDALKRVMTNRDLRNCYSYKLDISNYFNSIDCDLLRPILKQLLSDDEPLFEFIDSQLSDSRALVDGKIVTEPKGIMAGMPYAGFLANVFLTPLDREFEQMPGTLYCRYSDDIILFAKDKSHLDAAKASLHESLRRYHLEINRAKECESGPGEPWTFLGFECYGEQIDISKVSIQKMKAKMKRKARALVRWQRCKGREGIVAAKAFINHFNRKFYASECRSEVNWSWWYFPVITTDKSLKTIDAYMQNCIRYIATGSRTKARFNFTYDQMKEIGLQTLTNSWHKYKRN